MTLTAFVNAHVVPVAAEPFDGALLVEDGRITALGPDVEAPDGAEVVDCEGRWLLPGFVDAHVHLGMHAEGEVGATADVNEMTDPVMAGVRAIDAVDPNEPGWKDALAGGVTTVNVNPGSGNPIGGQAVALHTHGRTVDEMVLRSPSGVKSALGENPKNVYKEKGRTPSTRLGTALVIREAVTRAGVPDDAVDEVERLHLLTCLLPDDAAFSHGTAASLLGAPVDRPSPAHVSLTPRRVLPQRAEFVAHTRRLVDADVMVHRGLRLTSGAQTYLDLAEDLPPWELVAVGDALMRAGHLDAASLRARLDRAAANLE